MFYPLITARFLVFTISQLYLNDLESLQKSTNLSFSFIIVGYLISFKPFKDRTVLLANIVSEIMISAIFLLIFMKNIVPFFKSDFNFDCFFVSFILFQLGFEYLVSLYEFFVKLGRNCKSFYQYMRRRKSQVSNY